MELLRRIHKSPTKRELEKLWELGTFVFDTNVLLDLYRLPVSAKDDLVNILVDPKISGRIWLPFQAYLEFFNNRLAVICEQKNAFSKVRSILSDAVKSLEKSKADYSKKFGEMQVDKRHSRITSDEFQGERIFDGAIDQGQGLIEFLDELEHEQPDVHEKDVLEAQLLKAFRKRIGTSFAKKDLDNIYKEGDVRYKENVPPGYKDVEKEGGQPAAYQFEDKSFRRKYGDLVLWKEILRKSKEEKLEYVVLVTNDAKEGWLKKERGKTLGVRHELLNEIYFEASCVKLFHIYDTTNFMRYAKDFLKINVPDKSIEETKSLSAQRHYENDRLRSGNFNRHTILFGDAKPDFDDSLIGALRFYFTQDNSEEMAYKALEYMFPHYSKFMTEVAVVPDDEGHHLEMAFTTPVAAFSIHNLDKKLRSQGIRSEMYVTEPWSDG